MNGGPEQRHAPPGGYGAGVERGSNMRITASTALVLSRAEGFLLVLQDAPAVGVKPNRESGCLGCLGCGLKACCMVLFIHVFSSEETIRRFGFPRGIR